MTDIIHNDVVIKTESDIQITSNIVLSEEISDPIKEEKLDQFESDNDGNITDNLTVNYDFSVENEIFKCRKEKAKIITEVPTENDQFILDSNQKSFEMKMEDELQPLELSWEESDDDTSDAVIEVPVEFEPETSSEEITEQKTSSSNFMLIKESGEMEMITIGDNNNDSNKNLFEKSSVSEYIRPLEKSTDENKLCCGKYFSKIAFTHHLFKIHNVKNSPLEHSKSIIDEGNGKKHFVMVLEKSTDEKTQKNLDDHRFPRDTKGRFRKKTVDYLNRFPGNIANNEVRTENRASGGTLPKRCKYDTKLIQANNDQQLQNDLLHDDSMEKRRSRRSIFKCNGCEMRFSSSERHKCISHIRDKHCSESNTHDHGRTSISNIEPKENPLKREFNYLQSLGGLFNDHTYHQHEPCLSQNKTSNQDHLENNSTIKHHTRKDGKMEITSNKDDTSKCQDAVHITVDPEDNVKLELVENDDYVEEMDPLNLDNIVTSVKVDFMDNVELAQQDLTPQNDNCKKDVVFAIPITSTEKSGTSTLVQESGYCRICNMIVVMRLADHFKTDQHMKNVRANLRNVKSFIEKARKNHENHKVENVEA